MESEYPLNPLVQAWLKKIKLAKEFKKKHFQDDADTAMKFFTCGEELNEMLWSRNRIKGGLDEEEDLPAPRFRILVGKVSELVQLFGPSLYHRNPTIIVEPKTLDIPPDLLMAITPPEVIQQAQMAAQQAGQEFSAASLFPPDPIEMQNKIVSLLLQYYLDYIQRENDKKTHARRMIDEALIKGAGVLWTESYQPYKEGPTLIGSFYDTVDNLIVDPDAETLDECKWIARKCCHPVWEVVDTYGLDKEFIERKYGTHESTNTLGERLVEEDAKGEKVGKSNDLIEYWKIYSRMGIGARLSGIKGMDELEEALESFGDNCYIVIASKVPYPLNLHKGMITNMLEAAGTDDSEAAFDAAFRSVQWPIPFWSDDQWPVTCLAFHEQPNNPWPVSHIKPGLGYLEFITWCMSFLTNKLRTTCATVASCMKALGEEAIKELFSGKDFRLIPVEAGLIPDGDIKKAVHFFPMPEFNADIWRVLEAVFELFDKATGLTELAYGMQGGMRSATEVQVKEGNRSVRPDDMSNKVEDTMSLIARKEAMAARWLLDGQAVAPVLGQRGAALWEQFVMSGEIEKVAREFHYRVEAGSSRKPNKETRVAQMNQALQQWGHLIQWGLQTGNVNLVNAFLDDWGKAMDVEVGKYLLPPPPPPPPNPLAQKIEAEMQLKQQEGQIKQQDAAIRQQEAQMRQAQMAQTIQAQQAKAQMDMQKQAAEMAMSQQQMNLEQLQTVNQLQADQVKAGIDIQKARAQAAAAKQKSKGKK
jgi:hypothetical protein